jgi:SAM-dependent methyltransferase
MYWLKSKIGAFRSEVTADVSTHRIEQSEFLTSVYKEILEWQGVNSDLNQRVLEVGSAGGITKVLFPKCITSDIRTGPGVDLIASGTSLPFESNTFELVIAKDAVHHIPQTEEFFEEVQRVLVDGGRFAICETYWSLPAQFVYRFLHPEEYSLRALKKGKFAPEGNQALLKFLISNKMSQKKLYGFRMINIFPINGLAWLISGGVTFNTKLPSNFLGALHRFENRSPFWLKLVGFHTIAIFEKI